MLRIMKHVLSSGKNFARYRLRGSRRTILGQVAVLVAVATVGVASTAAVADPPSVTVPVITASNSPVATSATPTEDATANSDTTPTSVTPSPSVSSTTGVTPSPSVDPASSVTPSPSVSSTTGVTPSPSVAPTSSVAPTATATPDVTATPTAAPASPAVSVSVSTVVRGRTVNLDAVGFLPGEAVTVTLHSTPVVIANWTADATGRVGGNVTIPAATAPGAHTIKLDGLTSGVSTSQPITVTAALAETGFEVALPLMVAFGALAFGGLAFAFAYRRRRLALSSPEQG